MGALSLKNKNRAFYSVLLLTSSLVACSGAGDEATGNNAVSVQGEIAVAYVKRSVEAAGNPTDGVIFRAGGDLYVRPKSSPSSPEYNVTQSHTQGRGDVSDPEVSYDGKRILFSMRGPNDRTWNIWEVDLTDFLAGKVGNFPMRRLITDDAVADEGDDVDPAYLPDGRIVFSSNRQSETIKTLGYKYLDEYEREQSIVLHTMNANGTDIRQISFNMSHDRNPTVLSDGRIMFSRWDHVGARNQFTIFTINPDGTNVFVEFGAHSGVNSYLHPREMQDGRIVSDGMPLSGTREGGALLVIDTKNFAESNQPLPGIESGMVAQLQPTLKPVPTGREASENGRFTTPYPLWDGTNRMLVTFTPGGRTLEVSEVSLIDGSVTKERVEKTPAYGVYMFDLATKFLRPVALPSVNANGDPTNMITDPVALMPRPGVKAGSNQTARVAPQASGGTGRLVVKSVYDTDSIGRMGNNVLTAQERSNTPIPTIDYGSSAALQANAGDVIYCPDGVTPIYPNCDTRRNIVNIRKIKDPARTEPDKRPARFVRVTRAVPTPAGISMAAIGETEFEMQQIVGYAEVEPDGSLSLEVPAGMPVAISVLDANGRAFQTHTSWLQVQSGETVTCKGCHSPRRGSSSALNIAPIAGNNPNTALKNAAGVSLGAAVAGETMAETRQRLDPSANGLKADELRYADVWTADRDTSGNSLTKGIFRSVRYDGSTIGNVTSAGLTTPRPTVSAEGTIVINYPEHIQPIWDKACASCHLSGTPAGNRLDLSGTIAGTGRLVSYDSLMLGRPVLNFDGTPRLRERNGNIMVVRDNPVVSSGMARASYLIERLFNESLFAQRPSGAPAVGSTAPMTDHSQLLNPSEKRLIVEWIDLGAQYYNDPCSARDSTGRCTAFRRVSGLSFSVFKSSVQPVLMSQCAGCHVAIGRDADDVEPFKAKRLVLTGTDADFNITVSMVTDVCNSANSLLLRYPTSMGNQNVVPPELPHPTLPVAGQPTVRVPTLAVGSPGYNQIKAWIDAARGANGCQ